MNHNTREDLRSCLDSFQSAGAAQTIVVDNASTDGSAEMVREEFPSVQVIGNSANVGYGAAANQGIERSRSPHVLLLNSDTRLVDGSLAALEDYMGAHPRAAVVGPRLVNADGALQRSCFPFPSPFDLYIKEQIENWLLDRLPVLQSRSLRRWPHDRSRVVPYVLGAALAIRRSAFDRVGRFHPSYFMYFEEVDLCYRLHKAGWQVHFSPALSITHLGASSTAQRAAEMRVRWYESSVLFYRRNYPTHRLIALMIVMRPGLALRLVRDALRIAGARGPRERAILSEQIQVWKRALAVR